MVETFMGSILEREKKGDGKKGDGRKGDWKAETRDNRNIGKQKQEKWPVYGKETWAANSDGLKYGHTTLASPGAPGGTQHSKEMKEHTATEHPLDPWAESAAARRASSAATGSFGGGASASSAATGPAAAEPPPPAPVSVLS